MQFSSETQPLAFAISTILGPMVTNWPEPVDLSLSAIEADSCQALALIRKWQDEGLVMVEAIFPRGHGGILLCDAALTYKGWTQARKAQIT